MRFQLVMMNGSRIPLVFDIQLSQIGTIGAGRARRGLTQPGSTGGAGISSGDVVYVDETDTLPDGLCVAATW